MHTSAIIVMARSYYKKGETKLIYVWTKMRKCSHFINTNLLSHFTVDYKYGWDLLSEFYLERLINVQKRDFLKAGQCPFPLCSQAL